MRAYSRDLRSRIVRAVATGQSHRAVAAQFQVGVRTVERYVARQRVSGDLTPGHSTGRPRLLTPEADTILLAQLAAYPAATLVEHCQRLAATTGVVVSAATMSRAIRRLGWTRKKGRWSPGSGIQRPGRPGGKR